VLGAAIYFSALWLNREELCAILDGVREYGLRGSSGRYFKLLCIYSLAVWLGTGMSSFAASRLLSSNPRDWHWLVGLSGAFVASVGFLLVFGLLGSYRDKM
jgi:hypothetical protein